MARLTLDPTGIKRPLDVGAEPTPPVPARDPPASSAPAAPAPTARASNPSRQRTPPAEPFYGAGRRIQTSLAIDIALGTQLEDLSRAANLSFAAVFVAVIQAGLPHSSDQARRQTIIERAEHAQAERMERNVRLPEQLRARLDQLTGAVLDISRRATRADLVNAILRDALPDRAEDAAELVESHHARLELLALQSA